MSEHEPATGDPTAPDDDRSLLARPSDAWRDRLVRIGALAAVLLTWWAITHWQVWDELFVPRPGAVWQRFLDSVTTHDGNRGLSNHFLWEHLGASLWRITVGLFWGFVVGIPLGLVLASRPLLRTALEPGVNFLRSLPPLGYFSLLIIWFGIENESKVWLLAIASFAPITIAVQAGVLRIPVDRIHAARTLGASPLQLLRHVTLPSVLPDLLTGMRVAVGFAWTTIVAAETTNGIPGIGGLAWETKKFQQTDIAVLCIIVIGITAVALDRAIALAERRLVSWRAHG